MTVYVFTDEAGARRRGADAGLRSQRAAIQDERVCLYAACKRPLAGRKPQARWCSVKCRTYHVRAERRVAARRARPRCLICSGPLPYGKHGFNLSATTCSPPCHVKRNNWYVRGA